jgi:hypothetical protein
MSKKNIKVKNTVITHNEVKARYTRARYYDNWPGNSIKKPLPPTPPDDKAYIPNHMRPSFQVPFFNAGPEPSPVYDGHHIYTLDSPHLLDGASGTAEVRGDYLADSQSSFTISFSSPAGGAAYINGLDVFVDQTLEVRLLYVLSEVYYSPSFESTVKVYHCKASDGSDKRLIVSETSYTETLESMDAIIDPNHRRMLYACRSIRYGSYTGFYPDDYKVKAVDWPHGWGSFTNSNGYSFGMSVSKDPIPFGDSPIGTGGALFAYAELGAGYDFIITRGNDDLTSGVLYIGFNHVLSGYDYYYPPFGQFSINNDGGCWLVYPIEETSTFEYGYRALYWDAETFRTGESTTLTDSDADIDVYATDSSLILPADLTTDQRPDGGDAYMASFANSPNDYRVDKVNKSTGVLTNIYTHTGSECAYISIGGM